MEPLINKVPTLESSLTTNYFDNLAVKCMIFTIAQTGGDFVSQTFSSVLKMFTYWGNSNETDRT